MISRVIVVLAYVALIVHGKKLHEHMTKEEIESVFNVKHDSIHELEYDVLRVRRSAERDVYMKSSSHEYHLYLNNNNVLLGSETPIYRAKYNTSNKRSYLTKVFYTDYFPGNLKLYHDYKNQAAFAVHTDKNNNHHFDGVIGESVHIRSIPDRLHEEVKRNYSSLLETSSDISDLPQNEFMDNSTYHVIINKNNNVMHDARNNNGNKNDVFAQETNIHPPPHTYETRENTVYPELWINVDYDIFGLHGRDTKKIAKYIAAFWNAVDLRYRELTDPKVRLNIAGLTIFEDVIPEPNITEAADILGDYKLRTIPSDNFDVVLSMTSNDVVRHLVELRKVTGGFPYSDRACHHANRNVLVQDDGSFRFVKSATRVLGYLFGTDDDPARSYDDCDSIKGYIMSSRNIGHTSFRWSRCSKEAMKAFFNSEDSYCLKNKPYVGSLYPKLLPGALLTRDEQCLKRFGTHTWDKHFQDDCEAISCQPNKTWTIFGFTLPLENDIYDYSVAEGTSCGLNRICLDGYCVEDSPSYHSQSSIWNQ